MWSQRSCLSAFFALLAPFLFAQHPLIADLLDAVHTDSLLHHVGAISGEFPVDVGNGPEVILSRHKLNPGNALAQQWMMQRLSAWGHVPVEQSFSATGKNVLVEIPGTVHPGRKVVLCAHYDAMPGGLANAPAADDDGSGTAAVLEAARILAGIPFENTIVLALWDEEEQGKVGSAYYAGAAAANDDTLLAVVNMDAIAWDGDGDGLARIHTRSVGNSLAIKDTALQVNVDYGLNVLLAINDPGATYSDHASFWTEGYGSILVIEDFDNDGNPHYHTQTDLVQYFDVPYYVSLAKLAIGTALTFAVPDDGIPSGIDPGPSYPILVSAYPNPSEGDVRCWLDLPERAQVDLVLYDAMGKECAHIGTGLFQAGRHGFVVPLADRSAGTYHLRAVIAGGRVATMQLIRLP